MAKNIFRGTTEVSNIYRGQTAIDKVYRGQTEIWSAAAPAAPGYGTPTYNTGIQAYWNFGDGTSWAGSGTTVTDTEGNVDGTIIGSGWSYNSGAALGAIKKSATKSGQYISADSSFFVGNSFNDTTFEYVFRPYNTMTADNVFQRWSSGTYGADSHVDANLQQYASPKRLQFDSFSEQGTHPTVVRYNMTAVVNQWYHIVMVMPQGSNPRLYVNTVKTTSASAFGASDTFLWDGGNLATFGTDDYSAGVIANCEMALFRVYNTAMSDSDVSDNYNYFDSYFSF